jgi:hypothetical protein
MTDALQAIEMMGTIDEHRQLRLDGDLPVPGPMRVRVLVLYPLPEARDGTEWLQAAAANPAFASLGDPAEDLYTPTDGRSFHDQE